MGLSQAIEELRVDKGEKVGDGGVGGEMKLDDFFFSGEVVAEVNGLCSGT